MIRMVDQVAKVLCEAAGRSLREDPATLNDECPCCERLPDGTLQCVLWQTFRGEARAAIRAAHTWYKENRRWPNIKETHP